MKKQTKILLFVMGLLALLGALIISGKSEQPLTREDYSNLQVGEMPPLYFREAPDILAPDIVIFDISGTNQKFTKTTFEWSLDGDLSGKEAYVEFETLTPGKTLVTDVTLKESEVEFTPVTDQGSGAVAVTLHVEEAERTVFIKVYDLSLKLVCLEFDDAPSLFTEQLLDTLNDAGVSASFYVTGKAYHDVIHEYVGAQMYPETIRRTASSGHQIGSHTYEHPWINSQNSKFPEGQEKSWTSFTEEEVLWQVNRLDEVLLDILGFTPTYYAPPYFYQGHNASVELTGKTFTYRDWNYMVVPGDWKAEVTKKDITQGILSANKNATIVLHDVYQKTVDGVKEAINSPKAQNIQFLTSYELDMIIWRAQGL